MKVLLVNGSPHREGCTFTALSEAAKTRNEEGIESKGRDTDFSVGTIMVQTVTTSSDALRAGVSFVAIGITRNGLFGSIAIIGSTTFCISLTGVLFGKQLSGVFGNKEKIIVGLILAGIGIEAVLEILMYKKQERTMVIYNDNILTQKTAILKTAIDKAKALIAGAGTSLSESAGLAYDNADTFNDLFGCHDRYGLKTINEADRAAIIQGNLGPILHKLAD
ncbi:putative manganese efflux pump MntP [Hollandina sp. SP2]